MTRKLRFGVYVPLLCLVLLISVTSTAFARFAGTTQRISFASGATSAQVFGQVDGNTINTYLLNALSGQQMQVFVTSPSGSAYLTVVSPLGSPLARAQAGAQSFTGMLPESGDYRLQVSAPSGTPLTNYTLTVSVTGGALPQPGPTQRINFAPGTTSAQVPGQVGGFTVNYYLVSAFAGQQMQAQVISPGNNVYMSLYSPSGIALARAQAGTRSFNGALPETGDYQIRISTSPGGAQTSYTLSVSITGAQQPGALRIRFAPGATSAQVSGQVNGTTMVTYLLAANAGQRMQITVASPNGGAYLTVVSPSGSPLARAQNGVQSFDQNLPETGDYTLQVSAPAGTPTTTYLLTVAVTNGQTGGTTQRIRFATGATSAQVSGQMDGTFVNTYLLAASAGQRMQIMVASPSGNVFLTVVSPSGSPLARAQNGVQSFDQNLPETGDYTLQVSAPAGTPMTTYLLTVSVTNGQAPGTTQRIRFATGATSAQVSGQVDGAHVTTYLLNAFAGQRMRISLTSPANNVYLTVVSPGGTHLADAQFGVTSFDHFLPQTGDWMLQVSTLPGTALTNYTLYVSVTAS